MTRPVSPTGTPLRLPGAVAAWTTALGCLGFTGVRLAGLERGFPLVPAVSFTPYIAGVCAGAGLVTWLTGHRRAACACLAAAATLGAVVAPRAVDTRPSVSEAGLTLRVMSVNLRFGQADPHTLVTLVRRYRVDVLSVQELTPASLGALDRAGMSGLLPHRVTLPAGDASGSGLLARIPLRRLPDQEVRGAFAMPYARLDLDPPLDVVAVHPMPPLDASSIRSWRHDLLALPAAGRGSLRVLAGDFNATLDHAVLRQVLARGYVDAADATGRGLVATWPADGGAPPVTIDHVLVDRRARVWAFSVHDVPGSDHRAIIAEITVATRPG